MCCQSHIIWVPYKTFTNPFCNLVYSQASCWLPLQHFLRLFSYQIYYKFIYIHKKETDTWKISGCVLRGRSLCAGMMRRWKGQSLWPPARPSWHSELEEVDSRSLKTHTVEVDVSMWNILDYTGRDYGLAEDGNGHWHKMMFRKAHGSSYRQHAGRERREKTTEK